MIDELYKKYVTQYREFSNITDFNIKERSLRVPAEKHFWVEKLFEAKRFLIKLEKKRKKLLAQEKASYVFNKNPPVAIDKSTLDNLVIDTLDKLEEDISDQKLMVEFLSNVVSNVSFIVQDIKNIIETIKLEND